MKSLIALLLILALSLGGYYGYQFFMNKEDPVPVRPVAKPKPPKANITINGVMADGQSHLILINDTIYKVGDKFKVGKVNIVVKEIKEHGATFLLNNFEKHVEINEPNLKIDVSKY